MRSFSGIQYFVYLYLFVQDFPRLAVPYLADPYLGLPYTDKFIWQSAKKDGPCNPSYFRDMFKKALEELHEVRVLTPHCCRHTYVSQLQALGVDISTIQSIVGHMTL